MFGRLFVTLCCRADKMALAWTGDDSLILAISYTWSALSIEWIGGFFFSPSNFQSFIRLCEAQTHHKHSSCFRFHTAIGFTRTLCWKQSTQVIIHTRTHTQTHTIEAHAAVAQNGNRTHAYRFALATSQLKPIALPNLRVCRLWVGLLVSLADQRK